MTKDKWLDVIADLVVRLIFFVAGFFLWIVGEMQFPSIWQYDNGRELVLMSCAAGLLAALIGPAAYRNSSSDLRSRGTLEEIKEESEVPDHLPHYNHGEPLSRQAHPIESELESSDDSLLRAYPHHEQLPHRIPEDRHTPD